MSERIAPYVILSYVESRGIMKASPRMTANGLRLTDCDSFTRSLGSKR